MYIFTIMPMMNSFLRVEPCVWCAGSHLADHCASAEEAEAMRMRLVAVNTAWDSVCERAAEWQTRLQAALLEVCKQRKYNSWKTI
jgi:hypothetical protein